MALAVAAEGVNDVGEPRRFPAPQDRIPLLVLSLALVVLVVTLLRIAGSGWTSSVVGGLILTGAFFTFIVLVLRRRR